MQANNEETLWSENGNFSGSYPAFPKNRAPPFLRPLPHPLRPSAPPPQNPQRIPTPRKTLRLPPPQPSSTRRRYGMPAGLASGKRYNKLPMNRETNPPRPHHPFKSRPSSLTACIRQNPLIPASGVSRKIPAIRMSGSLCSPVKRKRARGTGRSSRTAS